MGWWHPVARATEGGRAEEGPERRGGVWAGLI